MPMKNAPADTPAASLVPDGVLATTALVSPRLVVPLGRGGRGKTVLLRWAAERANEAGRFPVIADADRTNRTLAEYFEGVVSPTSSGERDTKDWLDSVLERQIEVKATLLLDLGGGDQVLKQHAAELELVPFMQNNGVDVIAIHMLGPNLDDLAYPAALERDGTFAPERTLVVLNEGLIADERDVMRSFEAVTRHEVFRGLIARGAKVARMPRLGCLDEIEKRRVSFRGAIAGKTGRDLPPLGPTNRQRVSIWLRDMEAAFGEVAAWLP